jgi:hypothetical protein
MAGAVDTGKITKRTPRTKPKVSIAKIKKSLAKLKAEAESVVLSFVFSIELASSNV